MPLVRIDLAEGKPAAYRAAISDVVYRAVADGLHERIELRREDVMICLVEVKKENWSFGNGEAQYV
jgi:4-oxalocrotonate tautomerase